MKYNASLFASFLLRIGLAIAFLYAGVSSLLQPDAWISFFPNFLLTIAPGKILLVLFTLYQFGLGLWLLSGTKAYYSGLVSMITLLMIIGSNVLVLDIVFRDIALLFSSLSLCALHYKGR